eukprot:TRINITY_DN10241_c0_g1_i2.p1 TRINITY_DN10241_c0_g1~~TRINITY_DN10241_c0_g1_i2.p1  ORF type:complete len:422 (-),score=62.46 TRINITY_DN10241_c0_g1_i2:139-1404(-)
MRMVYACMASSVTDLQESRMAQIELGEETSELSSVDEAEFEQSMLGATNLTELEQAWKQSAMYSMVEDLIRTPGGDGFAEYYKSLCSYDMQLWKAYLSQGRPIMLNIMPSDQDRVDPHYQRCLFEVARGGEPQAQRPFWVSGVHSMRALLENRLDHVTIVRSLGDHTVNISQLMNKVSMGIFKLKPGTSSVSRGRRGAALVYLCGDAPAGSPTEITVHRGLRGELTSNSVTYSGEMEPKAVAAFVLENALPAFGVIVEANRTSYRNAAKTGLLLVWFGAGADSRACALEHAALFTEVAGMHDHLPVAYLDPSLVGPEPLQSVLGEVVDRSGIHLVLLKGDCGRASKTYSWNPNPNFDPSPLDKFVLDVEQLTAGVVESFVAGALGGGEPESGVEVGVLAASWTDYSMLGAEGGFGDDSDSD